MARVWIVYEPLILAELFESLFSRIPSVTVVPHPFDEIDVIVLPLNDRGQPDTELLPHPLPAAKLVAVSPRAERGFVRLVGHDTWQELRPFHLADLLAEVEAGRLRPTATRAARYRLGPAPVRSPSPWLGWMALQLRSLRAQRLFANAATVCAALVFIYMLTATTVAAAMTSLPGDPLYPVKRLSEQTLLVLAPPPHSSGLNIAFAERRLAEIEQLAQRGVVVPDLIDDMADSTAAAMANGMPEASDAKLLTAIIDLTQRQQVVLHGLPPTTADHDTQLAVEKALAVSTEGREAAVTALHERTNGSAAAATAAGTLAATAVAALHARDSTSVPPIVATAEASSNGVPTVPPAQAGAARTQPPTIGQAPATLPPTRVGQQPIEQPTSVALIPSATPGRPQPATGTLPAPILTTPARAATAVALATGTPGSGRDESANVGVDRGAATVTRTPTATASSTPTATATTSPTSTATANDTSTATAVPTASSTPEPPDTPVPEPTATLTAPPPTATSPPEPTEAGTPEPPDAEPPPMASVTPTAPPANPELPTATQPVPADEPPPEPPGSGGGRGNTRVNLPSNHPNPGGPKAAR
jgi:hypothetical protein